MGDLVIDLTRTSALGDPSTSAGRSALIELFRAYFENVTTACAEMRRAVASPEVVRAHAHRAKGASGVVGAVALTTRFGDLEAMAAAGETVPAGIFDMIDEQLMALRRAVTTFTGEDPQ